MAITDSTPFAPAKGDIPLEPLKITWRLHVLTSPDRRFRGRTLEIGAAPLRIGRSGAGETSVAIDDPLLSREHLELRLTDRGDAVDLKDLGSRNGTFRGGVRVPAAVLGHDAVLRCGSTVAILEADFADAEPLQAPTAELPGLSAAVQQLRAQLEKAAKARGPVALFGPTGAGKESALKELVRRSERSGPVVRLACAGQTAERMGMVLSALQEQSVGGWLVFEDLLALPAAAQALLPLILDAAQQDPAAARVACISGETAADLANGERLRPDVWARLRTAAIAVPALKDRRADLAELADAVAAPPSAFPSWRLCLDAEVWEALAMRAWPYGLHELRADLLKASAVVGLQPLTLPQWRQSTGAEGEQVAERQEAVLDRATSAPDPETLRRLLQRHGGNVERVAEHFGRHRKQIYRWIDRAGIASTELDRMRRGA